MAKGGSRMSCRAWLLIVSLLSFSVNWAIAQVDTGAILGTVRDQTGAVIPGVRVTLTNEETGASTATASGNDGSYRFTPVRIGIYRVTAEIKDFQTSSHTHVGVNIQQQVLVDFTLLPGEVTQRVEVTGETSVLQTQSGSLGQVVGRQQINDLPLNGRNFTFLAQLAAGGTFAQQDTRNLGSNGNFAANGMLAAQNNYLLDGIDNNNLQSDFRAGSPYAVLPPVDAIQEFKIQTSAFSAELGRAGGGVLNAIVKSGTNELHGNLWEFVGSRFDDG